MTAQSKRSAGYRSGIIFILSIIVMIPHAYLHAAEISFSADRVRSVFADGSEQTVLQGNARVVSDDFVISAENIQLRGENYAKIQASGSVSVEDAESGSMLSSSFLSYDRDSDNLTLEGAASYKNTSEDISVDSTYLEKQGELVVFQLDVRIRREGMVAEAEYVRYFEDAGRIELSGYPVVYYEGDEYRASRITVYTEDNEIVLEGEVRGEIHDSETGAGEDSAEPPVEAAE